MLDKINEYNNQKKLEIELKFLNDKIDKLEKIILCDRFTNIQIHFFADGKYITITQQDIPFSLKNELEILINASINQHNIDKENIQINLLNQ